MRFPSVALLASTLLATSASARFLIYADEWHPTRPTNPEDRAGIDHVVLAFAPANATAAFQPKVPINTIRSEFPNAKVSIAVGGWGDDIGFFTISQTDASIQQFAADIATMLTNTGADGVDIDWEYPGGNGADYKQVLNSQKVYQIDAYPKVLQAIRAAIGDKLLTIAVPGKKGDMIAFTKENGPKIWPSVDYINVMSYDLMNRRDNVTNHHTSVAGSEDTIKNYLAIGAPPAKINLGFAYYAKYFTTQGDCGSKPLGCPIVLAEDPVTGKDTLTSGAWTFEPSHMVAVDPSNLTVSYDGTCGPDKGTKCATGCCSQYGNCGTTPEHCSGACQHAFGTGCTDPDVAGSWQSAAQNGVTDAEAGGQYYFDAQNLLFWTWDTPDLITRKFDEIVKKYKLGGVMAWSLGEDSYDWSHIKRMAAELANEGSTLDSTSNVTAAAQSPEVEAPTTEEIAAAPTTAEAPIAVVSPEAEQLPSAEEASAPKVTPLDSTAPEAESVSVVEDVSSPTEAPVAPSSSPTEEAPGHPSLESNPNLPYDVVWVDGTDSGPEGDYSEQAGSPTDYVVYNEGNGPYEYNPTEAADAQPTQTESAEVAAGVEEPVQPSAETADSVAPVTPNTDNVQPEQDPALLAEDSALLPVDSALPTEASAPAEASILPAEPSSQPSAEAVQSAQDWASPADSSTSSTDDATALADDTALPVADPDQEEADATWAQPVDEADSGTPASNRVQAVQGDAGDDEDEYAGGSCRLRRRRRAKKV